MKRINPARFLRENGDITTLDWPGLSTLYRYCKNTGKHDICDQIRPLLADAKEKYEEPKKHKFKEKAAVIHTSRKSFLKSRGY